MLMLGLGPTQATTQQLLAVLFPDSNQDVKLTPDFYAEMV
jgi:hypothetical protein